MLKSSLLEIIRTFSKQELIKFEDFVRSPYFNKKENVIKLFLEIKKYAPEFTDINLEKEKVWEKLFLIKEYNYGIMKNLIFELNKFAEQYIVILKFNKDEYIQNEFLLNALLDRKLHKIYNVKHNAIDKEPDINYLSEHNIEIDDYLNFMNKIYETKLLYHQHFDKNFKIENLQLKHDSFKLSFFLLQLFGSYANSIVSKMNENIDPSKNPVFNFLENIYSVLDNVLESVKKYSNETYPYVKVFYQMIIALKENSDENYLEFKNIVFDNLKILPRKSLQSFHYGVFLALNLSQGKLNKDKETLEIFDSLIENNLIVDTSNNIIPIHIFHIYIISCFNISDSVKLELFFSKFIDKIEPDQVEQTKTYVKFMIFFINKDFNNALHQIVLSDVPYFRHKIRIKYQKAMCIYELGDYEMFLNEFDSQKHFLNNNKLIEESSKTKLNNYFLVIKKLFILKQDFDIYEFNKLKDFVLDSNIDSSPWFNEKLDEIKKANK